MTSAGQRQTRQSNRRVTNRSASTILSAILLSLVVTGRSAAQLPPVPEPAENPITEPKRVLGKILFWDEQLSSDNTIACGTCHLPKSAGTDPRLGLNPGTDGLFGTPDDVFGSPGVARADENGTYYEDSVFGWGLQVTGRSAPIAVGAMYASELFWDGRAGSTFVDPETMTTSIAMGGALESQAVGPPLSDMEMAHENRNWGQITAKLASNQPLRLAANVPADMAAVLAGNPSYPDLFTAAFGDGAVTAERIAFALATYERTLLPDQTPWDAFVRGNTAALTAGQQAGWDFFLGSQCVFCHPPPLFTDHTFRNVGLRPVAEDIGRQQVTGDPADRGKFKVPTLRNGGLKASFMHNGRLTTMTQVIDFYAPRNGQIQFPDNQDPLVPPLDIPQSVVPGLVDFLTNGLTDPRVAAGTFPFDRPTLYSERVRVYLDFEDCFAGPGNTPNPTPPLTPAQCLSAFDEDTDGDVDMVDYSTLQRTLP